MNIALVIWVIAWPLSCALGRLIQAKTDSLKGDLINPMPKEALRFAQAMELIIWVCVGSLLYGR